MDGKLPLHPLISLEGVVDVLVTCINNKPIVNSHSVTNTNILTITAKNTLSVDYTLDPYRG